MSFAPSRLLIFGATGAIGKYITEAVLAAKPAFSHVSIFTSTNTATTKPELLSRWKASGVSLSVVVGDVTSADDVANAYKSEKPDTVISALGRGALHVQTKLVELAEASESVKWLFPSEYGTDIEHNAKSPNEKPHQNKLALRKYIRENVKKLHVTYLVTGPYFDMWVASPTDPKLGRFDAANKQAYVIEDGEGKIGFCTMLDVGKFLVAALRHPQESFGKALKVQSFVVTPNEVVAAYEKQTGGDKWQVTKVPLAELQALEEKAWADGIPTATAYTLRRIWAEGGTLYEKNDNELIGVGPNDTDSLATAVGRALASN
ncbi:isoflavone reductase family protein [Sporothrix brasiliensis 5110]|uniref:Isoflavone reductase family protein n=1 Tax=Sporothrix brasiliensis 5110 TaxID=1398154 RepID=A0A0C2EX79_9PEZI|nr:isoflavone reductase family protein [Sporothrix brasiliensis 5110]KIH91184.1 isoflavone reductase family protein [Sporothrix brasiliensis 5110]